MIMMPFVRLIAIYAIVGAAIFAFLKRDQIMAYMAAPESPAIVEHVENPPAETAEEVATTAEQPSEPAETTPEEETYSAPPVFGSQITPQYFGQAAAPSPRPTPQSGNGMVERWTKAREVFSQGNPTEAAKLYEALTADFPDNADLQGETGNLYYNLGKFNKAAVHYLAVGEIAHRAGNRQMAGSMLALLQRISPSKAAELQATLNTRP